MLDAAPARLVREKLAVEATPETDAVTMYAPAVVLAVKTAAVATPEAFVVAVVTPPAKVPLAPLPGAAKVTTAPLTGLLNESLTVTCSCVANAVLTVALCGVPAVAVMVEAEPTRLVSKKFAGEETPETEAVTVKEPAVVLAVMTAAVATPEAFVVAVVTPPANVPLAPLPGAAKVTTAPITGLLNESLTVACNCVAKAVFTVALCGVPAVAVIVAGTPATPPAGLKAAKMAPQLLAGDSVAEAETLPAAAWI